jgi:hypothetical protein
MGNDLLSFILNALQSKGQQQTPMTPTWNGGPNPMAGQQTATPQRSAIPTTQTSGVPAMAAQQARTSGGIGGFLQNLISNPNMQQGLAQLLMSRGTYGGARGMGFQNQIQQNKTNDLAQQKLGEDQRQFNETIGLNREQLKYNQDKTTQIEKLATTKEQREKIKLAAEYSVKNKVPIETAARFYDVDLSDPSKAQAIRTMADDLKRADESDKFYIDTSDPLHPKMVSPKSMDIDSIDESKYYIGKRSEEKPSEVIKRLREGTESKGYQDAEIIDSKSNKGHRSVLFNPNDGTYVDPDSRQIIKGAQKYYQPAASIQIASGQDPEIYAEKLGTGEITPSQVPSAIRDKALKIATDKGYKIVSDTERATLTSFKKIEPIISSISDLSERINTGQGIIAKAGGAIEKAKAQANLNDDVAEYQSLISGFTPLIARSVGHVGVLTQQDVDSVKALFPAPGDSKTLRDRKMAGIKRILGGVQEASRSGITEPIVDKKQSSGMDQFWSK